MATAVAPKTSAGTIPVLIADQLSEEGVKLLRSESRLTVDMKTGLKPAELAAIIAPYEGLVVRSATKVTAEVIQAAAHLKVIGRAGVGLDNVDVDAATKRGIICMNVPGGNTVSAAEHTMALLLAAARRVSQADRTMHEGKWDRSKFVGTELMGKTLGVIGLGKIGMEVAKRAQAFGMRLLAFDPFLSQERAQQLEVQMGSLTDVLEQADFLTVHTPLTAQTRHLIGAKELARMKPGAYVLNCARGGIIDEAALYGALKDGHLAGAGIDVFESEPPGASPLLTLPTVVATPHLGASTEEAQLNVAIDIARQVADALLGRGIRNAVNMPSVDGATLAILQPYITLSERMGSLAAQLLDGQISEVRATFVGEVTNHNTAPLTLAILKGLLEPIVGENVNYVNASLIAAERGIKVVEVKATRLDEFANLIALDIRSNGAVFSVHGTLSARREPRIVKLDRYVVETAPAGHMLVIRNADKPGLIGHLGMLLGEAHINIASMTNGREQPGGDAITVVNVDDPVPPKVLEQIKHMTHVIDAKLVSF